MCRRQSSPPPPGCLRRGAAMSLTLRTSGLMGTKGSTGVRGVSRSLSIHNSQALAWRKRLRQALSDRLAIPISTAQLPEGQGTDNISKQGSQHLGRPLEFALTLEGPQLVGLRLVVSG